MNYESLFEKYLEITNYHTEKTPLPPPIKYVVLLTTDKFNLFPWQLYKASNIFLAFGCVFYKSKLMNFLFYCRIVYTL